MDVGEDIKATADKITGGFFAPFTVEHAFLAGAIERAILAERERCAKIALAQISDPGLSDNPAYIRYEPSHNMARKIASAIRFEPQPPPHPNSHHRPSNPDRDRHRKAGL